MFDFEKLDVYAKVETITTSIFSQILNSQKIDPYIKDQLKRATLSVLLNLAEGTGRLSITDKRHFYVVSRSSLYEVVAILKLLQGQNFVPKAVF